MNDISKNKRSEGRLDPRDDQSPGVSRAELPGKVIGHARGSWNGEMLQHMAGRRESW